MSWDIKGKDNTVKATVDKIEYNGEWMGEVYVTVTVESPVPIAFAIGDYLIYRGERFEINYDPGKIKCAEPYKKGDAFKYENIKFNSLTDELTRCDFLDIVLNDNNLHFTGLPKFTFYGGVQDLANRIQANLNRAYPNQWTVTVSPEYSGNKELNVSVDNQKVWDALSILVNDFETYFTIKGRTITIGAAGVPAGHLFKYGKGNGLYEIEQTAEADQAIVTRLRAYGSTRNLPHRYYNSLTGADGQKLIPDNMAVQNLMLPSFPYTTQDPYIDSPNISTLGIREGTIFFDGSQEGLEEIYPSIEGMTAEQLIAAGVPCNSTGALDVIVSAEQMTDNGVGKINEEETQTEAEPATFKVTVKDLGFDINDCVIPGNSESPTVSFKTGMLGGRDFEIVECKPIKNSTGKTTGYELELNRVYDDGIKLWFPYKDYNAKAGDKFVLLYIQMPEVYIKAAAQRLKEAAQAWLAKNDYSRSVYAPKVDEIFMARQHDEAMASGGSITSLHDTLCPGMMMLFEDEDLNIDASIFIDRLTIKEGDSPIPTYEVTLKEEKTVGRLDKMQNQIDSLASGGQGGGGYNASQIRQMIDAYGGTRFLSKIKGDRTPYALAIGGRGTAEAGMQFGLTYIPSFVGGMGGWIGADGAGELESLVLRRFLEVPELRFNRAEVIQGVQWHAPGGGIVESCEGDTVTLKLEQGDIGAVAADDLCIGIWHFAKPADTDVTPVNLITGTGAPSTIPTGSIWSSKLWRFDKPVPFRVGDRFCMTVEGVEVLQGNPEQFHAVLREQGTNRPITELTVFDAETKACVLEVIKDSDAGDVALQLYNGLVGRTETAGNQVRYTHPMLVRGETPAQWQYAASELDTINAEADSDDGNGQFRFSGFATMYFRIKSVSGDNNNTVTIQMRPGCENMRPQPGMHFVAFGNPSRKDRQTCRYATRTYERLMKGVDDWTFRPDNIKLQLGDLSNLTIDGMSMSGYSIYLNNVYFDGVIRQIENSPLRLTYETYGDKYVGDNDDCMVHLTALKGVEDVTDSVTWSVSASTGAAVPSVTTAGTLKLGKSVLGGADEATVTVTATWRKTPDSPAKTASAIIIIRDKALLKGDPGSSYTPNLLKGTKTWGKDAGWTYGAGFGQGSEPDGEMNGFAVLHGNFEGLGTQAYIDLARQNFPFVNGQTYTLSFWAKGTGQMQTYCYPNVGGFILPGGTGTRSNVAVSDTSQFYPLTTDWQRHRVSFRVDGTPVASDTQVLFRASTGSEAWIAGAKLELGVNNNPEWSPNEADLKGEAGKDGEDGVTYEWETDPGVIHCKSDGTPIDTSVTVRCWRVKGESRSSLIATGSILTLFKVQYRVQADEGVTNWTAYTGPITLDSRDTHPKVMLRVITETAAGAEPEPLSQHSVGNVCDGAEGPEGDPGSAGPQGPVVRIRGLFAEGYYYDGTKAVYENGVPVYWLDIVWVEDSYGNRYYKRCVKSGSYTSANGPHATSGETSAGWSDFSQLDNLIVDLLIAKNAHIQFLNGQEIVFGETVNGEEVIYGRIGVPTGDAGVIMWAGGADTGTATYLLDKNGRTRFGKTTGNHIVIDPNEKQITVRNSTQRRMVTIDGEQHVLESIYGVEDNINPNHLNGTWITDEATYTQTVGAGTIKLTKKGGTLKVSLTANVEATSVEYTGKDATGVAMPGLFVRGAASVTLGIYNGNLPVKEVTTSVQSPAFGSNLTRSKTEDLSVEATGLSAGTYMVRVKVSLTQETATDINGSTVRAVAKATAAGAAKTFASPEQYESFIAGNGAIFANSILDYFRTVLTDSGYMTEMSAGNYGLRVSRTGLIAKDTNGAWNAVAMTCDKQATDANKCVLEQTGSRMYTTTRETTNLPFDAASLYGAITTITIDAEGGNHIQEWKSYTQPVHCYTRRCLNGTWGAWVKNY